MADPIFLDNDYEIQYAVTRRATATGLLQAATGLTGLTCFIAATSQGAPIHAALSLPAVERSGTPGAYYAIFDGDLLSLHLLPYANKTVFVVLTNAASDIEAIVPVPVRESRIL